MSTKKYIIKEGLFNWLLSKLVGKDNNAKMRWYAAIKTDPKLRKLSKKLIDQSIEYYAKSLGLGEQIYHEVGTYSKGMRQKLAIAMTLIHDPEMVLLDEPASGLDPRYTKLLKDWIKNLSANGRTVLLSTHIIEMAETLCDKIGIIDQGKMKAMGTVQEIQNSTGVNNLEDAFIRLISI